MHDQPDAGLWEFRTKQLVHTYSAVMSWAACDRLGNVAARIGKPDREAHWNGRAAKIRETIEREAWDEAAGHYGAAFGPAHLDASLLQMVELRYIRADNPRFQSTFPATEKALRRESGGGPWRERVWAHGK